MVHYYGTLAQVVIVSLVCFCTAGMFNAMTSLGGGGKQDPTTSNNANIALYATLSVFGLLAGAIHNLLGPRLSAALGALPYGLYTLALWNTVHDEGATAQALSVAAGALLGVGAAVMWTAQGALMMSYPTAGNKGRYIGIFWAIFNAGPVLGNLITTAVNWDNTEATASDTTYLVFAVLMFLGVALGLTLASPRRVRRDDGSPVALERDPGVAVEVRGLLATFTDRKMLLLVPASLASNFFYTIHFNALNGANFSFRTRSFNSIFYWGAQIGGAVALGKFLDNPRLSRARRGLAALALIGAATIAAWVGFFVMLGGYYADGFDRDAHRSPAWDLVGSPREWAGPFVLYAAFGLLDAAFQSYTYWLIGALSDDRGALARYAGFYKGVQSVGGALAWAADGHWKLQYVPQAGIAFALLLAAMPPMALIARGIPSDALPELPAAAADASAMMIDADPESVKAKLFGAAADLSDTASSSKDSDGTLA